MDQEAENHTPELLRRLRADMADGFRNGAADIAKLTTAHQNLTTEVRLSNAHVAALVQGEVHTAQRIAELDARLARVEKRLELRDE